MDSNWSEEQVLGVSELNNLARRILEDYLPVVLVEGEVSNLATPASGHIYFALKDSQSSLRCAMFRQSNRKLDFPLENGVQVIAAGKISIYTPRGDYQLIAHSLRLAGAGNLQQQYEQLKKKLHAEGLFSRARPLPKFPGTIGVITSPHGAAVMDVLSVLRRRCPSIKVIIYPCPVQGAEAAAGITSMLQLAAERAECEVLLLVRGGGSLEDMQPFNEETVARAIAACPIPVVSGVGHEVDFCIADFAADLRAATPSAAAESVSPEQEQLYLRLAEQRRKMLGCVELRLEDMRQTTARLVSRLKTPETFLETMRQRVDELQRRVTSITDTQLRNSRELLAQYLSRLRPPDVSARRELLATRQHTMLTTFWQSQRLRRADVVNLGRTLQAMNPDKVLERGYAMAYKEDKVIEAATELKPEDKIKLVMNKGVASCLVEEVDSRESQGNARLSPTGKVGK